MPSLTALRKPVARELQATLENFACRRDDNPPTQDEWRRMLDLRKQLAAIDQSAGTGSRTPRNLMPTIEEQRDHIQRIERERSKKTAAIRRYLLGIKEDGRDRMTSAEQATFRRMERGVEALDQRIEDEYEMLGRLGDGNPVMERLHARATGNAKRSRGIKASMLSPLHLSAEQLHDAYQRTLRREPSMLKPETRDFTTADSLIPAQLAPVPVFPEHEHRLLNHLPGFSLDAPSYEFVQVTSVSGSAAITPEGTASPELLMPATKVIVTAQKIAANVGLSFESADDWTAFTAAVTVELTRQATDAENLFLLYGLSSGGTTPTVEIPGLTNTTGVLTHDLADDPTGTTPLDAIEMAIAQMRVGPSLATPDILVLHPSDWSAIRRQKDDYARYLVAPDPTQDEAQALWGIPVIQTTMITSGTGLLIDSSLVGVVAVREPLGIRIGFSGTDFVQGIWRYQTQERLALCIERPSAVMVLSGLPTS